MDYWALIFFFTAVILALFGLGSITNSVALLSRLFAFLFFVLAVGAAIYQQWRGEDYG